LTIFQQFWIALLIRIPFATPRLCKVKPQNGSLWKINAKRVPRTQNFCDNGYWELSTFLPTKKNWFQCSSGPNAKDDCGNAKPFIGNSHFLSEDSECEWAAITCPNPKHFAVFHWSLVCMPPVLPLPSF